MEQLTKKQLKFLKKNRHKKSPEELSQILGIDVTTINLFVKTRDTGFANRTSLSIQNFQSLRELFQGALIPGVIIFLGTFFAYLDALFDGFASDDIQGILENPRIHDLWFSIQSHAPGTIIYSFLTQLNGTQPFLFHLNSILWHLGIVIIIFLLTRLLSKNLPLATITALLFAVHPLHTEAVTWISGLPYLLYTFFTLMTLFIYILVDRQLLSKWFLSLVILFTLLAVLSSEKAIILPLLLLLYGYFFSNIKKTVKLLLPVFGVMMIFGIFLSTRIFDRIQAVAISNTNHQIIIHNPFLQIPVAITTYLKLHIFPAGLSLYHEDLSLTPLMFAFNVVVTLLFLGAVVFFLWKKNKLLSFALLFFPLTLIPTLLPVQISWIVAERYVYPGSWGILLAFSMLIVRIKNKYVLWTMVSVITLACMTLTFKRNLDWKNQDTLFLATVRDSPTSSKAWNNMGDYYGRHGDIPKAMEAFSNAVKLKPGYADAWHNLGNTYLQTGNMAKAAEYFHKALELNPFLAESAVNLAAISFHAGKLEDAKNYLEEALKSNPNSPFVYNAWGIYYKTTKQYDKAREMFTRALTIRPDYQEARTGLDSLQ